MTTETKTGRPPLPKNRAKTLDVVAHRATCAYCAWVGPDRPLREPNDADEREHLAVCPKNPAREIEAALSALRAEHQRLTEENATLKAAGKQLLYDIGCERSAVSPEEHQRVVAERDRFVTDADARHHEIQRLVAQLADVTKGRDAETGRAESRLEALEQLQKDRAADVSSLLAQLADGRAALAASEEKARGATAALSERVMAVADRMVTPGRAFERVTASEGHEVRDAIAAARRVLSASPGPGAAGEPTGRSDRDAKLGLYEKYRVERTDGSSAPGGKHAGCRYYVLDLTHDQFSGPALAAYANACEKDFPLLARDLRALAPSAGPASEERRCGRKTACLGCPDCKTAVPSFCDGDEASDE